MTRRRSHSARSTRTTPRSVPPVDRLSDHAAVGDLLQFIARYRLATPPALTRAPELSAYQQHELHSALETAQAAGLVACAELAPSVLYLHLTPRGARYLGLPRRRSGPLSPPSKVRAYGMLLFCLFSDIPRQRLTSAEIAEHFRILYRPGMPGNYYIDTAAASVLGLARIDTAPASRSSRLIQALRQSLAKHESQPVFRRLIRARRFELAVITPWPTKAAALQLAFGEYPELRRVATRLDCFPQLQSVVPP